MSNVTSNASAPATPPTAEKEKGTESAGAQTAPPMSKNLEAELRAEIALLKEELARVSAANRTLEELLAEQEKARAAKAAKKASGPKTPVAKVAIIGEGRRQVKPGQGLRLVECEGLVEGVHFELVET